MPIPPRRSPDPVDPRVYRRLFEEDSDGQAVLAELWRIFAKSAVCEGGIDAILKTYKHDGAREILEFIVTKINRANGVTEDDHGHDD